MEYSFVFLFSTQGKNEAYEVYSTVKMQTEMLSVAAGTVHSQQTPVSKG